MTARTWAVIVAGGRSSRLGLNRKQALVDSAGLSRKQALVDSAGLNRKQALVDSAGLNRKQALVDSAGLNRKQALVDGEGLSLLEHVVDACAGAQRIAVVGPRAANMALLGHRHDGHLIFTQEDPPLSGPACGIVAGVEALRAHDPSARDSVMVLGGDLPHAASAVKHLMAALSQPCSGQGVAAALAQPKAGQGVVALDPSGQRQWLLGAFHWEGLAKSCAAMAKVQGGSVRRLLAPLVTAEVALDWPECADIDTWDQAKRWGFAPRSQPYERTQDE